MSRLALSLGGVVQGVGFRPFVRRAAESRGLVGWVQNGRDGVRIEVQGPPSAVEDFLVALSTELPAAARIDRLERQCVAERDERAFDIVASDVAAAVRAVLPADLATCAACLAEVTDPQNRRHRYPFTNCAHCGPRFTIVNQLPYDRPGTTMASFPLCDDCEREFRDVDDRRYHAQPIACPSCGPELTLVADQGGGSRGEVALQRSMQCLRAGEIVAVRGVGGFQLLVDAHNEVAVRRLRNRKRCPHKPLALMFRSLADIEQHVRLSTQDAAALARPEAPIVLLPRGTPRECFAEACGDSPWMGAMLANTALHWLILEDLAGPVVCTSGNLHDEPMCTEISAAVARLEGVADRWLSHDRPIVRPMDDSLVRAGDRGVEVLRRARGYAPLSVATLAAGATVLAVGAHLKSAVALAHGDQLLLSQHLGDLVSPASRDLLAATVDDLCAFYEAEPEVVACDLHPDYASTQLAETLAQRWGVPLLRVQHHHAHIAAVMAEHALTGDVLGLAWDGAGLGTDGTVWGGEALVCRGAEFRRTAHLESFRLIGAEAAMRSPRRVAMGLLADTRPDLLGRAAAWFDADEEQACRTMLERDWRCPPCTSIGRLFDAVAALVGLVTECSFEGQAALTLEACAARSGRQPPYPLPLTDGVADLRPLVSDIVRDVDKGVDVERIAMRFHMALIELGVAMTKAAGIARVALSGGCFANRILADGLHARLRSAGFEVHAGRNVPPGDNGIAVGQAFVARAGAHDVSGHSR